MHLSLSHIKGYLTWLDLTWLYPPPAKKFRRQAWHTHRTGLQQLAITKLQLFFLDWTMNWNVILPIFRHHLMLSVDWHSGKTDLVRCYTASFPLWNSISLQAQHHKQCWDVFFRFAGTFAQENAIGQVPSLSNVHFLEWTNSILAWMAIDSSLPAWETNTNCCQNLMLRCLVCILFALLWTVL